jgi:hypothetical protein
VFQPICDLIIEGLHPSASSASSSLASPTLDNTSSGDTSLEYPPDSHDVMSATDSSGSTATNTQADVECGCGLEDGGLEIGCNFFSGDGDPAICVDTGRCSNGAGQTITSYRGRYNLGGVFTPAQLASRTCATLHDPSSIGNPPSKSAALAQLCVESQHDGNNASGTMVKSNGCRVFAMNNDAGTVESCSSCTLCESTSTSTLLWSSITFDCSNIGLINQTECVGSGLVWLEDLQHSTMSSNMKQHYLPFLAALPSE